MDGWVCSTNSTEAAPPLIPTEPNDPETGNPPWADPDRAQDGPLLQAINSARSNGGVWGRWRVSPRSTRRSAATSSR
ncbi:MAG: hypothetical protein IPN66_06380 [Candidatus Competibacteraceae bacterium]|nr:hypothetical protein [Candidatus Competibacteraceae bacterium]